MSYSDIDLDEFHDAMEQEDVDNQSYERIQPQQHMGIPNESIIILPEMPSYLPPSPPKTPSQSPSRALEYNKTIDAVLGIPLPSPIQTFETQQTSKKEKTSKKKKKKKKHRKQKKHNETESNAKRKSKSYEQQYKSSSHTWNHDEEKKVKQRKHKNDYLFVSWFPFRKQNEGAARLLPTARTFEDRIFSKFTRAGQRRVNIGQLNSAEGEGTTVPELLLKMRVTTFFLAICTIVMEICAFFFHVILLEADKIVMGVYLIFFVGLLICYEIVRGQPRPGSFVDGNWTDLVLLNQVDLVWKTVLESKFSRQMRYFLQDNFGILYSCWGRGIYLCFVGGIAFGQGILWMGKIVGGMFVAFGIWTISLKYRIPMFEKALVMDLDNEFKPENRNHNDYAHLVTWTSFHGKKPNNFGERQRLIHSFRK